MQAGRTINVFCVFSSKEYKLGLQLIYFLHFLKRVQAGFAINAFCVFSSEECKRGLQLMYFVYFPPKSECKLGLQLMYIILCLFLKRVQAGLAIMQ